MRKMLINCKHYWQEDSTKEKENTKVSYPLSVSIVMKLVILLQGVHKRRLTKKGASKKIERRMMEKTLKVRSHVPLLMKMMMKWYMLQ